MIRTLLHNAPKILKDTFLELTSNDPLRMAGATAFFTSFALPPIVMIIVRTLGLFLDKKTLGRQFSEQLRNIFGADSTESIMKTIQSFRALQHNYLITAGLFIFLLFVATTLFKVIKNSINEIWNIRKRPGANIAAGLQSRGLSVVVILLGGVFFLGMQLVDAGQHLFGRYLMNEFPVTVVYVGSFLNEILVIALSAIWFFVLFVVLPDGKPHWKVAMAGALMTSILFNAGKWVLQLLLKPGQVHNFYGASGALVLLLLFVFYSSIILYFGAAFIKVWGNYCNQPVRLRPHVMMYELQEVGA